jgi:vacuolar protein sorting-associated protein 72
MRELLEKAHQQDDDDLFKEEEGDEEFAAPSQSCQLAPEL